MNSGRRYARTVPRRPAVLLLVTGLVLFLIGVAVLAVTPRNVGWFAYAPLSESTFAPPGYFLRPAHLGAAGLATLGLVGASWAAGYLAGTRVHPNS